MAHSKRTASSADLKSPPRWGSLGGLAVLTLVTACNQPSAQEARASHPPPSVAAAPQGQADDEAAGSTRSARAQGPSDAGLTPAPKQEKAEPPPPPPPPTFGPAQLTKLSPAEREAMLAGNSDDPIPVEIHYIQSNETRHDLYFPYIKDLGGAYAGVGSDQNYTMIGSARSELAFLMDIDQRVVDLHHMYSVFIVHAQTPEELVALWKKPNATQAKALLDKSLADLEPSALRRIQRGYNAGRETVFRHLMRVIGRKREGVPTSWLSDPAMYDHVRALYQTGRVRIMAGDLTGANSLQSTGAAAKALGVPVRVFYMSNAEEYFDYKKQFVANVEALVGDPKAMLLRTIYSKKWEHADLWAYQVQPLTDFRTRLENRINRSRNPMFRYAEREGALDRQTGNKGLSRLGMNDK